MRKVSQGLFSLLVLALVAGVPGAYGNTITAQFVNTTGLVWNYSIAEDANGRVVTGTVPTASTPFTGANLVADYFTIYDFVGFTGATTQPAGWAFQSLPGNLGSTDTNVSPTDSATIPNLTWYRTGAPLVGAFSLAGFSATSSFTVLNASGFFTSEDTHQGGPNDGATNAAIGTIVVPTAVPEPGTLFLLGSGLVVGLGVVTRRRFRTTP